MQSLETGCASPCSYLVIVNHDNVLLKFELVRRPVYQSSEAVVNLPYQNCDRRNEPSVEGKYVSEDLGTPRKR